LCNFSEEIDQYNEDSLWKEKEHLLKEISPFDVIEYIKNSIEILLNMKDDDIEELREELNRVKQREKALIKKQKSNGKKKQPELLIKDIQDEEVMGDGEIFRVDK